MSTAPWKSERYQHLGLLGRGSFAEVHLAFDRLRGHEVALKLMHRTDGFAIGELRKEFRALRDIDHPNVVALHELHADDTECFVTMEAVRGLPLGDYARQEKLAATPAGVSRILACLAQLCEAIAALHQHGLLHRDLKPANVMVSDEGRLILLDAGLAKNIESQRTDERYIVGTLAYMAPEQAMAEKLDEACDWYAFAVIAFELFTGKVPFQGQSYIVQLQSKTLGHAPPIATLAPELAASHPDTARIIDDLLSRHREARPGLAEIRDWLAASRKVEGSSRRRARLSERVALVGRDRELALLDEALVGARARGRVVARVEGPSGMGKSALVHHWLADRALGVSALVGRCYQGELTPFAGLDEILASLVAGLDRGALDALLAPHELAALQHTFGRRLGPGDSLGALTPAPPDPLVRRRALVDGLHRLALRVASPRTVVLALDDAQWAAPETLTLIAELAERPWPDGLCLLLAQRSDDPGAPVPDALNCDLTLDLGPLDRQAAMLVARRATAGSPISDEVLERVVSEAAGHPFLLETFAAHVDTSHATALTLDAIVHALGEGLDPDARAALWTLAVASEPLPNHVVLQASGLATSSQALRPLFACGLVRRAGRAGTHTVIAHDRFAKTLAASIDEPTRRARHLAIADALVAIEDGEPELPVAHYLAAGAIDRVLPRVTKAARRLREGLALTRSESLYHIAIAHAPEGAAEDSVFALKLELAELLIEARRNEEAARLFLALAEHPQAGSRRASLQARAAIELIRSGHVDEGFGHARASLSALGVKVSKRRASVLPIIAWHRVRLALRGEGFRLRPAADVPGRLLERIDWCQDLGVVLPMVDTMKGFQVHNQGLLSALEAGEPARLSRGLAMEAGFRMAIGGGRDPKGRVRRMLETARMLALASGDERSIGTVDILEGSTRWSAGDWSGCVALTERGVERLQRRCRGASWEVNFGMTHLLDAVSWLGQMRKHLALVTAELAHARARGDLYAQTIYTVRDLPTARLVEDRVVEARACSEALSGWVNRGFQVEHMADLYQQVDVDLYAGEGARAFARIEAAWRELSRHQLMSLAPFRVEMTSLLGRALLGALADTPSEATRAALVKRLARVAARLRRERPSVRRDVFGAVVLAGAELAVGRREAGLEALVRGVEAAAASGMRLHGTVMSYWLGQAEGGRGAARSEEALAWMRSEGFVRPERYVHVLGPGLGSFSPSTSRP